VNTHDKRRCWAVSCAWSHRGQASGCGSPRLVRRSAVKILPFNANQMKNLQRRGAQLRQILCHAANFMEPTKKASVSGLAAICTTLGKLPSKMFLNFLLQDHSIQQVPNPKIVQQNWDSESPFYVRRQTLLFRACATVLDLTTLLGTAL